jgi:hypothetical protein
MRRLAIPLGILLLAVMIAGAALAATLDSQDNRDPDGDGLQNWEDACPNEAGPASNAGCPAALVEDVTDHGAVANDGANDTAAFNSAMQAAGVDEVVYVPVGTFHVASLDPPSNTEIHLKGGATLKPAWTTDGPIFVLQGVQNTSFATNIHIAGVDGDFTIDISTGNTNSTPFRVRSVDGFSIKHVDILGNNSNPDAEPPTTTVPGISFLPMDQTKIGARWEHAHNGVIEDARMFNAARGFGLTQLTGAEDIHFENIASTGGVALRLENFESSATTIDDITANDVTCINGHHPTGMNPHNAVNGNVQVTNIVSDSCAEGISLTDDDAFPNGQFGPSSFSGLTVIPGDNAQVRNFEGSKVGSWEQGSTRYCIDAEPDLAFADNITVTDVTCNGVPNNNWPQ